jgi:hypothetical protein
MNIRQHIELTAGFQDHYETFQVVTPIPMNHPPSLKNPQRVKQPDEIYKDAAERKKGKKRRRSKRKPGDLAYTMRKSLNQGRHVMVHHSKNLDPNLWNPSQIADL